MFTPDFDNNKLVCRQQARKAVSICLLMLMTITLTACSEADSTAIPESQKPVYTSEPANLTQTNNEEFYETVMLVAPFLPANQNNRSEGCSIREANPDYKTAQQVDYANYGWESRISHEPEFFDINSEQGRILVIDLADADGDIAYRYLSNDNSHNQVYEPWSSSKIFAYTGAIASMREQGLGAQAKIGESYVADMITGINSYDDFGTASGDSNALATFFANVAGRGLLTDLFYDKWLKLSTPGIYFRGAYGPTAFVPANYRWEMLDEAKSATISPYLQAADDPDYLEYRCENCGLTGNKPMTTLAQAEWLKRLAVHQRQPETRHPNLLFDDVQTLFYGTGHSYPDERFAGMTLGISTMLQQAIANAMVGESVVEPKETLDALTQGEWRVFQKIGWGPSETRTTTENVVLAHVCLPHFQGGREFTVAAQVSVPQADEANLPLAGKKMLNLLQVSMDKLLRAQ
jgi:hypothetical protein